MDALRDLFSKRVAGVPVALIAAVVAAAALWGVLRFVPKAETTSDADDEVYADDVTGDYAGDAGYGPFIAVPGQSTPTTTFAPETQDAWIRRGVQYLTGLGVRADVAQAALTKYVNGDGLTYDEGKYRDQVVAQNGVPPELPTSIGATAPEAGTAGGSGRALMFYTVPSKGNTISTPARLDNIARRFNMTVSAVKILNPAFRLYSPTATIPGGTKLRVYSDTANITGAAS